MQGITECILKRIYHSWAQLSSKLFRLISSLNSVEYEIGFRLEGFFSSLFFFIIHLLHKLNRLHLRSYGRWSSLFLTYLVFFLEGMDQSIQNYNTFERRNNLFQSNSNKKTPWFSPRPKRRREQGVPTCKGWRPKNKI